MNVLTPKQLGCLKAIWRHVRDQQLPPTQRELASELEVTPTAVQQYIAALRRKGCLRPGGREKKARALALTELGFEVASGKRRNIPSRSL